MDEFQPGNKTIYVVFDEESEFLGPRTNKLSLEQVVLGKPYPVRMYFLILSALALPRKLGEPLSQSIDSSTTQAKLETSSLTSNSTSSMPTLHPTISASAQERQPKYIALQYTRIQRSSHLTSKDAIIVGCSYISFYS